MKYSNHRQRTLHLDILFVSLFTLITFILARTLNLTERFYQWSRLWEDYQADELLFPLLSLSIGLIWLNWRRHQTLKIEDAHNLELLAENRRLNKRIIETQEQERLFLAQELHDVFAQHLTALRTQAELIDDACDEQADISEYAQEMIHTIAKMHQLTRSLLKTLRPPLLDFGVVMLIEELVTGWRQSHSDIDCDLEFINQAHALSEHQLLVIYRVTQEALSNIVQHANASNVNISLNFGVDNLIQLYIRDNGKGFNGQHYEQGLGLIGIRERAYSINGDLTISENSPHGTELKLIFPLDCQEPI